MAVIVTISAIAVPNLLAAIDSARVARAVGDIRALEDGISLYQVVNGGLPDDLSQVGYAGMLDPWRNPYQYLNRTDMRGNGQLRQDRFAVSLNTDYELYSMGKDGASSVPIAAQNSQDDVIRAGNGSYLGLAKLF
jgi:general secretion pathway protein G